MKAKREIRVGDYVAVKPIPGHISEKHPNGEVMVVLPPYCKVFITHGPKRRGEWTGLISDCERW
jgi:hypothetical protein